MDEKIEQVIALAGNEHKYQYFTLGVVIFLWINCNFISCVLTFLEREPLVSYYDAKGEFHNNVILSSDVCLELDGRNYTINESFGYSWITEYHLECKSLEIGNIGSFAFFGNAAGGFVFSFISKIMSHKKILIISSFGFCIAAFLCTLIKSFDYFYVLLFCEIFIGLFGNCLCYSSLVVAQEIVANNKRSLFSSIINIGYAFCGIIYALLFYFFQDWRIVFYILIGASAFTLILIWVFIYDSPRAYINNNNYEKVIDILEGIASFNGKLDEFRDSIQKDEYQDIISVIKGERPSVISDSLNLSNSEIKDQKEGEEKKENPDEKEIEFSGDVSEGKIQNLTTSLISQEKTTQSAEVKVKKINIWSLFKYPSIRYKFLILDLLWVGTRASFNGVAISSKSFPGNFYVNMIVLYILEAISYIVSGILIDIKKLGRRGTLWIEYALLEVIFILLAFLNLNTFGSLALNYISRFCVAGIEVIYYTYSIEIYPTPVRSVAFGINATFGNLGSVIAPQLIEILLTWQFLVLFAVITAINATMLICLPETVGKPMVESIPELNEEDNLGLNIPNDNNNEEIIRNTTDTQEDDNWQLKIQEDIENNDKNNIEKKDENKEDTSTEKIDNEN